MLIGERGFGISHWLAFCGSEPCGFTPVPTSPKSLSLSYLALFSQPCKQLASQKVKKERKKETV